MSQQTYKIIARYNVQSPDDGLGRGALTVHAGTGPQDLGKNRVPC